MIITKKKANIVLFSLFFIFFFSLGNVQATDGFVWGYTWFGVDTTAPALSFESPTPANNSASSTNNKGVIA